MPCYHPLTMYRKRTADRLGGKRSFTFNPAEAWADIPPVPIPCGQCIGCRTRRASMWKLRLMHEKKFHQASSFVTLTISPENLAKFPGGVVPYKVFQDFMKRLRASYGVKVRFFEAFEYGDKLARPHFHAIFYGLDFSDDRVKRGRSSGHNIYSSARLESLWRLGLCFIGDVTDESAGYVAQYCLKKITGEAAKQHYLKVDSESGEIFELPPEHCHMSRRPGIGADWYQAHKDDIFPDDVVVVLGKRDPITGMHGKAKLSPVPAFYSRVLEREDPKLFKRLKRKRLVSAVADKANSTPERLAVRKAVFIGRGQRKRDKV